MKSRVKTTADNKSGCIHAKKKISKECETLVNVLIVYE